MNVENQKVDTLNNTSELNVVENDLKKITKKSLKSSKSKSAVQKEENVDVKSLEHSKSKNEWKKSTKLAPQTLESLYRNTSFMLSFTPAENELVDKKVTKPKKLKKKKTKKSDKTKKPKRSKSVPNKSDRSHKLSDSESSSDEIKIPESTKEKQSEISSPKDLLKNTNTSTPKKDETKIKRPLTRKNFIRQGLYETTRMSYSLESLIVPIRREVQAFFRNLKQEEKPKMIYKSNTKLKLPYFENRQEYSFLVQALESQSISKRTTKEFVPIEQFFYKRQEQDL